MNFRFTLPLFAFLILSVVRSQAQELSPNAEISVLTIGQGDNLNDAFGHNAFRINDRSVGMDIVYGYGEYDFETDNFYLKFAQGKLNYKMSKDEFADFFYVYSQRYNRTIEEQVLNLSSEEKQTLYNYLRNNYKPENRKYLYDFFYDNCATRIRDVVQIAIETDIDYQVPANFQTTTFRQLIYNQTGHNNWGSFGIDVALGSVIDKQASPYEHMFLPRYIHKFFGTATLGDKPLVKSSTLLYKRTEAPITSDFMFSPLMVFGLIALLILYITYSDYKQKKRTKWLDVILFSITGLIGILVLLLWFATDHTATANNYNLLWAVPFNILVIGQLLKVDGPNPWFNKYLKFLIIMLCLMAFHWISGVQVFAIGLIPLLIALLVRYIFLLRYVTSATLSDQA